LVFLRRSKKGASMMINALVILIMGLIVFFVYTTVFAGQAGKTTKLGTCRVFTFGKEAQGYCVAKDIDCSGTVNIFATGCPKETPVCCLGEQPAEGTSAGTGATTTTKKGDVELWIKGKLDPNAVYVPDTKFVKIEIKDVKAGNTDAKAKRGVEFEIQARGRQDVKFCYIEIVGKKKSNSGTCNATDGPGLKYAFPDASDYDVNITGYDKKSGEKITDAVADIKVE